MDDINWDRTVFALIAPDALARHLGIAVLNRMESLGFMPVAWRVLWHRPADLDTFHERNIRQAWQAYLYRLVDQLFEFGPTVALLLADRRETPEGLSHQRLVKAKGSSDPAKAGSGTIRGDFGSINVMLGLMHSSDSPADSARESAVFGGPEGLPRGSDPQELRTQLAMVQLGLPREHRGYREVLAGLRARSLAAAWEELPRPLRKTTASLLETDPMEFATSGSGERLAALLPADHPLTDVIRADFTPAAPGPDLARVAAVLRLYGTGIDPWENLVLATSRRFWPRGTDRPAGDA